MLKHLLDLFERQPGNLGVEEDDQHPANAADDGIKPERAAGSKRLHEAEKRAADDDVGAPARAGEEHGAHGADLHGEEVGAHPCRVADGDAVGEHKGDNEDQNHDGWGVDAVCIGELEGVGIDWDPDKRYRNGDERDAHAPSRADEDLATSPRVNEEHVGQCAEEIGAGDNQSDGYGIREADEGEEGRAVVHESCTC